VSTSQRRTGKFRQPHNSPKKDRLLLFSLIYPKATN
jgi:hypothetical protein